MLFKSKLTLIPLAILSLIIAVFMGSGNDSSFSFLETQVMADSTGEGTVEGGGGCASGDGCGGCSAEGSAGCCSQ